MWMMLTVFSGVVTAAEPVGQRATEMPELASMALLSVVLAGVSVAVRRTGSKSKSDDPSRTARRDVDKS